MKVKRRLREWVGLVLFIRERSLLWFIISGFYSMNYRVQKRWIPAILNKLFHA